MLEIMGDSSSILWLELAIPLFLLCKACAIPMCVQAVLEKVVAVRPSLLD